LIIRGDVFLPLQVMGLSLMVTRLQSTGRVFSETGLTVLRENKSGEERG